MLGTIVSFIVAIAMLGWLGLVVIVVGAMLQPRGLDAAQRGERLP